MLSREPCKKAALDSLIITAAVPLRTVLVQVVALDAAAATSAIPAATALT